MFPCFFLSELYNDDKVEEDKSNSDSRGALKAVFREMVIPAGAFFVLWLCDAVK